jgi:hypothetical protein
LILTGGGDKALQITSPLTTSTSNTPRALILEDASGSVRERTLGTMAWEASTNYYSKTQADSTFLKLSGGTLTGELVLDNAGGISLDSVTITKIDTSADGLSVDGSENSIPTSYLVESIRAQLDASIQEAFTSGNNFDASNGLTLTSDTSLYELGGVLNKDTDIDIKDKSFKLKNEFGDFLAIEGDANTPSNSDDPLSYVKLKAFDTTNTLYTKNPSLELSVGEFDDDSFSVAKLSIGDTYIQIYDGDNTESRITVKDASSNPMIYNGAYTATLDNEIPRWRQIKDYADQAASGENETFANGVSELADGSIGLGGDLSRDTNINTGEHNFSITGNTNIIGNLIVDGSLTTINSVNLDVSDNIITVNAGETGNGVSAIYSGIRVDRGDASDYMFIFDENSDTFRIGIANESSLPTGSQAVATREDSPTAVGIPYWNGTENRLDTTADLLLTEKQLILNRGLAITTEPSTLDLENTALVLGADGSVGIRELSETAFTDGKDLTVSSPLTISGGTGSVLSAVDISILKASSSHDGYLSSSDWTIFNNKIDSVSSTSVTGAHAIYSSEDPTGNALIKQLKAGTGVSLTSDSSAITVSIDQNSTVSKYNGSFNPVGISTYVVTHSTHNLSPGYYQVALYENGQEIHLAVDISVSGDVTFNWTAGSLENTVNYIITG